MPARVTPERLAQYLQVLEHRDNGLSFREIATLMNFADPRASRFMWIGGLRHSGRANEIPVSTTRRVAVTHNGRTTTLVVDEQTAWTTNSTLTFGIEIECVGLNTRRASEALNAAGILCEDTGYTHARRAVWKVVTDGSLTSRNGSCEVVSPVLSGTDGLTEVRTVMMVLRNAGATINTSCGMHIHIGVDVLPQEQQVRLIKAYTHWQWAFTAWILERRVNGNWSQLRTESESRHLVANWEASTDLRSLATNYDRYYALNVASYARHGTFEMRSHHGSLNGQNATAWIALHLAFVDACATEAGYAALCADLPRGARWVQLSDGTQAMNNAGEYLWDITITQADGSIDMRSAVDTHFVNMLRVGNDPLVRATQVAQNLSSVSPQVLVQDNGSNVVAVPREGMSYATRADGVEAAKQLVARLDMDDTARTYLTQRAGNIPARNVRNTN